MKINAKHIFMFLSLWVLISSDSRADCLQQCLDENKITPVGGRYDYKAFNRIFAQCAKSCRVQKTQNELDSNSNIEDENDRPDLVFLTIDSYLPNVVTIVELKSPNLALRKEHYDQLDSYRFRVEGWLKAKYAGQVITVKCLLIGDLDTKSTSQSVMMLNEIVHKQGPHSPIVILPLRLLLEKAKQTHVDAINVASNNEEFYESELSTTAPTPAKVPKLMTSVAAAATGKQEPIAAAQSDFSAAPHGASAP